MSGWFVVAPLKHEGVRVLKIFNMNRGGVERNQVVVTVVVGGVSIKRKNVRA